MLKQLFSAALTVAFTISAFAGGVKRGDDQTMKTGYQPGTVVVKFTEAATSSLNFRITTQKDGLVSTGIPSIDALNKKFGATSISKEKLYQPRNASLVRQLGIDRIYLLKVPENADVVSIAEQYARDANIEFANPDWEVYYAAIPNDPLHTNHWGHNNTAQMPSYNWSTNQHNGPNVGTVGFDANAQAAWDGSQGYGSTSVIIAILDGGVNWAHPDLRIWQNDDPVDGVDNDANGKIDDVRGWDFGSNDNDPNDNATGAGHGTACAGVAAAIANNALGSAGIAGGCTIMPLKCANSAGSLLYSNINNAIYYAADNGADVISMSLGSASQDAANQTACTYAWNAGVVVLAATGNENKTAISYPAGNTSVVGIGAASNCGDRKRSSNLSTEVNPGVSTDPNGYTCDGERWWGSNYGSTVQNAATAVDVIAPTILPTTDIVGSGGYDAGDYSLYFNGTSCSTPYAAGVCALIISKNPTWTPQQVRDQLCNTAQDIVNIESAAGWDRYTGYGMVDAAAAVGAGGPVTPTIVVTSPNGGESWVVASSRSITWGYTGTIANVAIEYSTNGGSSWISITASTANTGSFAWIVPNTPSTTSLVRVSDASTPATNDASNAVFTITTSNPPVTIFSEGFEVNTVPGGPWTAADQNGTSGLDYWGDQSSGARIHSGSWSAYCADNSNVAGQVYDHNMNSYMAHSGLAIGGYTGVQVSFWIWYLTSNSSDYCSFQYYNGSSWVEFSGGRFSGSGTGSQTWAQKTFTVPAAAGTNFRFRWIFFSNGSGRTEGAYIDDIAVTGVASAPGTPLSVGETTGSVLPTHFALDQNYPNPFNPSTTIRYHLPEASRVSIKVFNVVGQEVATLVDDLQGAGVRAMEFNASALASGVYHYRITATGVETGTSFTTVRKMMVLK